MIEMLLEKMSFGTIVIGTKVGAALSAFEDEFVVWCRKISRFHLSLISLKLFPDTQKVQEPAL
jgi:hypothetical protein